MVDRKTLKKEADAFDRQTDERIRHGFIPDLRRLRKVDWFYNNPWRDPEIVRMHVMPKIDFIIGIAKKRGGRVLEIGCGFGYLSLELARNGLDVVGIDISPRSIDVAKKFASENTFKDGFGTLEYLCGDIMSMGLEEAAFDSVVFFGTLHHMQDVGAVLSKVGRSLREGGNLIVCEPVRENFTMEAAEFAAVLRAILPTWLPYEEKLKGIRTPASWQRYVKQIYDEYTYKDHEQSPCDNSTASEKAMLDAIGRLFEIKTVERHDAFLDKLIGGLRGDDRYRLAEFLKFLDEEMIRTKKLKPTSIWVHAVKA